MPRRGLAALCLAALLARGAPAHPSWPAVVACLLAMESIARHVSTGRKRWVAAAGAEACLRGYVLFLFFFRRVVAGVGVVTSVAE